VAQLLHERHPAPSERWEPLSEIEQVTERMRRVLEQTFGAPGWPSHVMEPAGWVPLVDVEEHDDAYVLKADLAGVKRKDVNVEVVGNELTITGEVKEPDRTGIVRRRARRTGRFDYRLSLPAQVDAETIEADLSDGVLTVRVPKSERAQRRQIEIKSS